MRTRPTALAPFLLLSAALSSCAEVAPSAPESAPASSSSLDPIASPDKVAPTTSSEPAATAASIASAAPKPDELEAARRFAKASNAFGLDLYREVKQTPGNLAMSPVSLSIALAVTWAGAKGETSAEMKKVLHLQAAPADIMSDAGKLTRLLENPSRPLKLAIASRMFGEKTYAFEKPYLDSVEKSFGAALEPVDFIGQSEKARLGINGWVEQKTQKRIVDLVPSGTLSRDTRLVLVNAVYFLADWQQPFDKAATQPADFAVSSSRKVRAATMHQLASFNFAESNGTRVLELSYKGGDMSMLLALPSQADGIDKLEQSLTPETLAEWEKKMKPGRVSVALPKFEINPVASTRLGETLEKLGMKAAFDRKRADFTAIANPVNKEDRLSISQVLHKAFVKVDEKGTEAAAATAVSADGGAAPTPGIELKLDRPFVYLIRDNKSGLVLFVGRVSDPTVK
jgi:serpin B